MDLSAVLFYKTKFEVSLVIQGDLLWKIILHIRNWQTQKWNRKEKILPENPHVWSRIKSGSRITTKDNCVYIESEYFAPNEHSGQYWACRITETPKPEHGVAPRKWITEIGYEQQEKNKAVFSCVLSYSDRAEFIGPYQAIPQPSVPNLIRKIIYDQSLYCFIGTDEMRETALELKVGDWPDFLAKINNESRQLPYVFISPKARSGETPGSPFLVDPQKIAKTLFGNALVFFTKDSGLTAEMRYMNPELSCYDGALRVYQPNAKETYRHRSITAQDIVDYGAEEVILFLRRAFSQNVNFYDSFFRIEECRAKKSEESRHLRLLEIQESHQHKLTQVEDASLKMMLEEEEKRLEAEDHINSLQKNLNEQKQRNYSLEAQIEQLRASAEENSGLRKAVESRNAIKELPGSINDVIHYFQMVFNDRIDFSEDAIKSARRCSLDSSLLWKIFHALATVMCDLYETGSGDIFDVFLKETGIECSRGEGAMTRRDKVLMRQFETKWNGEVIDIEAHITYPREKQSIHFGYSKTHRKVIIGHCGEHLDIYSTRKAKRR